VGETVGNELDTLTSHFAPVVADLTRRCVDVVAAELPEATMKIYAGGWKNVQFRVGHDILAAVNPLAAYVNVNLGHALELEDPQHVLEGTGKSIRHVKVRPGEQFPEEPLRDLLRQLRRRYLDD